MSTIKLSNNVKISSLSLELPIGIDKNNQLYGYFGDGTASYNATQDCVGICYSRGNGVQVDGVTTTINGANGWCMTPIVKKGSTITMPSSSGYNQELKVYGLK